MSTQFGRYYSKLKRLERVRQRAEEAYKAKRLKRSDVEVIYESLLLRAIVGFEALLEEIFFQIMQGKLVYKSCRRVKSRISASTAQSLYDVAYRGKQYLDWLPFRKAKENANVFLLGGRPFTLLDDADCSKLQAIVTIRHAIAHRSEHGIGEFRKLLKGQQLTTRDSSPAGYLRHVFRLNPRSCRLEEMLTTLRSLAHKLSPEY